jgi:hypothetical protein
MQQTASERQAAPSVTVEADSPRPIHSRKLAGQNCKQISNNGSATPPCQNTQCFICSRIYFDQRFRKCPHCNSDSVQHYTNADLSHFARDPIRQSFEAGT